MNKEELFNSKLDELQEKYSKLFAKLEAEEKGSGNIHWHTVTIKNLQPNGTYRVSFGVNTSSPLPNYLREEILVLWNSLPSDI